MSSIARTRPEADRVRRRSAAEVDGGDGDVLDSVRTSVCECLKLRIAVQWFLDMRIDQASFETTLSKIRNRRLDHEVADEAFRSGRAPGQAAPLHLGRALLRRRHVVEGVGIAEQLQTPRWLTIKAAHRAQRRGAVARRARTNDTHASTADPGARLYHKSNNTAATPCYSGHLFMEHRCALIVDAS